ncbi:MAG: SLBB domain-containing protein [Bacteroidota bacterium]
MKRLLGILCCLLLILTPALSQVLSPEAARRELQSRGIPEDEVKKRMLERGIDVDNIDPTNAAEVAEAEQVLEQVLLELEAEATTTQEQAIEEVASGAADNIQEAVEEGQPLDEAIAEEIIDTQTEQIQRPPARVYGQQIFRDKTISVFTSAEDVRPSANYVMGPGDRVNIAIWGYSQEEITLEVNTEGYIKPSRLPRISLKGKTYQQARELLRSRYAQYYNFRPEEFEVTITYARTITVNILGEVFNPGSYTLPATNTAFNALVAAGGPSDIGSVRNIRLIRAGEPTREIDVYEFMNDPAVQDEFYLQDNDVIHVGTVGRTVDISGAVRRPFVFELEEGEELRQLLRYAGGLADNAYRGNLQVKRYVDDRERILDVNFRDLEKQNADFPLLRGDRVVVPIIPGGYDNFVEIVGAVELAGQFELMAEMKVADLLAKGVLREGARRDIAFLLRQQADSTTTYEKIDLAAVLQDATGPANIILRAKDQLRILSQKGYVDQGTINIEGAVRQPTKLDLDQGKELRLDAAIILAGGLRADATDFAYVYRTPAGGARGETQYIRINLREAIANPQSTANLALQAQDRVEVLSQYRFVNESFVKISGAVREPGEYRYDATLTLTDILTLAGGLRLEAARNRIDISRIVLNADQATETTVATIEVDENLQPVSGTAFELQPYDQIVVRSVPNFELQRNISVLGEVSFPGQYALVNRNERIWSVIKRAGGLTDEAFLAGVSLYRNQDDVGYIIVELDKVRENPDSRFNFILKEGDVLNIPKRKDLVTIQLSATQAAELYPDRLLKEGKLNVAYQAGKNAKWYLEKYAAGVGKDGRRSLISVEHPNGRIEQTKGLIFKRYPSVEQGSVVSVGEKPVEPEKEMEDKEDIDWGRVLADSITQATAILTLILLIQRLD